MQKSVIGTRKSKIENHIASLSLLLLAVPAEAATYSISPNDSWNAKLAQLQPGDTLILKDGTYGPASIDCSSNTRNGTASAPITLKAEHERRAFLQGDGREDVVAIQNCTWWVIEGFRMENRDYDDGSGNTQPGVIVSVTSSHNISLKRNLLARPNRYGNNAGIGVYSGSSNILIEENELYSYHRNGISCSDGVSGCIVRRNYIHPRDAKLTCPPGSDVWCAQSNSDALILYGAADSLVENNIAERSGGQGDDAITSIGARNQILGNIAFYARVNSFAAGHHGNPSYGECCVSTDNLFEHNIAVDADWNGLLISTAMNLRVNHFMAIGNGGYALFADNGVDARNDPAWDHAHDPSITLMNSLAVGNGWQSPNWYGGYGITNSPATNDWSATQWVSRVIEYSHGRDNGRGTWLQGTETRVNSPPSPPGDVDPQLGTCKVWIPDNSPMKRAGKNGADIGANVLYRYENGVLTTQPLWDPVTGQFPCGAIVPGVNDIAGSSCFDVHQRLNVNTNGCPFPAGYGETLRGDLNGDGKRDLADVRLLIYMLIGQQPKTPEADLTGDGAVTLADVQALIRLLVGIP